MSQINYQDCNTTPWGQHEWCYPEVHNAHLIAWGLGFIFLVALVSIAVYLVNNK